MFLPIINIYTLEGKLVENRKTNRRACDGGTLTSRAQHICLFLRNKMTNDFEKGATRPNKQNLHTCGNVSAAEMHGDDWAAQKPFTNIWTKRKY